jgi:hypothetical protein
MFEAVFPVRSVLRPLSEEAVFIGQCGGGAYNSRTLVSGGRQPARASAGEYPLLEAVTRQRSEDRVTVIREVYPRVHYGAQLIRQPLQTPSPAPRRQSPNERLLSARAACHSLITAPNRRKGGCHSRLSLKRSSASSPVFLPWAIWRRHFLINAT